MGTEETKSEWCALQTRVHCERGTATKGQRRCKRGRCVNEGDSPEAANEGPLRARRCMWRAPAAEIQGRGGVKELAWPGQIACRRYCMLMLAGLSPPCNDKDTISVAELIDISRSKSID